MKEYPIGKYTIQVNLTEAVIESMNPNELRNHIGAILEEDRLDENQQTQIVKKIVWTSPEQETMRQKLVKMLESDKFKRTID